MSLIYAYKSRGLTKDLDVRNALDEIIQPGVNDKLRVVIGREGALGTDLSTAKFVVVSDAPTANGSSLTIRGGNSSRHRLRLDAADLTFPPGVYSFFFDFFDNADAEEWKNIERHIFCIEDT